MLHKGVITTPICRPLVRNTRWAELVQLIPFVDAGWGWNQRIATPAPRILASLGLGARWTKSWSLATVPLRAQVEVFWGYRLLARETPGGDLQDKGLHLQAVVAAF